MKYDDLSRERLIEALTDSEKYTQFWYDEAQRLELENYQIKGVFLMFGVAVIAFWIGFLILA